MSRFLKQWKSVAVMAVFVIAVAASGFVSEAKTISKTVKLDKEIAYVGEEVSFTDVMSVKINNKATSKSKKKIKTSKTDSYPTGFSYHTKSYFKDSDAYNIYDDYKNAYENAIKYVAENDYRLRFLKPGTYTISYVEYTKENLDLRWDSDKYVGGKYVDYYKLEDNDGKLSSELFEEKVVNGEYYYQGVSSKKIYAYGYEGYEGSVVAAAIKTGADKKQHVSCQPRNIVKTTYSRQYKVLKTSKIISSVQLGKTKLKKADSMGAYSSSSSSQRSFLSGNSGKLTVKTADPNYSIQSIVVETYDKEGKSVYTKVSNKKKVNYGLNKYSYKSSYASWEQNSTTFYKPTIVYVCYKNKFTGAFTRVDSIAKDQYGYTVISYTYRYAGDTKDRKGTARTMNGLYGNNKESYTFYKK